MGRGFFSGVFWGLLLSGIAGASGSLIHSNANIVQTSPETGALEIPAGSGFNRAKTEEEAVVPQTDTVKLPEAAPMSPVMVEVDETPVVVDTATAQAPAIVTPEMEEGGKIVAPAAEAEAETVVSGGDKPISPTLRTTQPAPETPETVPPASAETPDTQVAALPTNVVPESPAPPAPMVEAVPETPAAIRIQVPEIRNLAPNVKVLRLPATGDEAGTTEAVEQPAANDDGDADGKKGALAAYAMAFENPDAKPMMSVILIDNPDAPMTTEALERLPFALSFAIDASRGDANDVAARYRAAGFEVLMLTNLPTGAAASDVEVAFEAYSKALPEAVAVLNRGASSKVATQLAGIMADRGFGLVTPRKGLNSTQKAAIREGVPAALIHRNLDAKEEKPAMIRRYLDRAAFRAIQEGSVIMLGHTRPETIEALILWALEDRAANVVIAPVSAVLMGL